jgi:hypothetical protein
MEIIMKYFKIAAILLSFSTYNTAVSSREKQVVYPTMPALRAMLIEMVDKDQTIRKTLVGVEQHSIDQIQSVKELDKSNTERLKIIFSKYGWPNSSMVGRDGVEAFFLIAQHTTDQDFRRTLLPHIEKVFNKGEISPQSYAMFVDGVLVSEGKPQKYGTQIKEFVDKMPVLYPIENRTNVNAARGSIGLINLEDYLLLAKIAYFPEEDTNAPFSDIQHENDKGGGIGVEFDLVGSGPIESMTLKSLIIEGVSKGSPAEKAGISVGDRIIEMDNIVVKGCDVRTLIPIMEKPPGDHVVLVIEKADGTRDKVTVEIAVSGSKSK